MTAMPHPKVMTIHPEFSRLRLGQHHCCHHAVAEQDQEPCPDDLGRNDSQMWQMYYALATAANVAQFRVSLLK